VDAAMAPPSLDDASEPEGDVVRASETAPVEPEPRPQTESPPAPKPEPEPEPPDTAQGAPDEEAPTILEPSSIIDLKGLLDDLDAQEEAALTSEPEQETQALDTSGVELDPEPASLIEELPDAPEEAALTSEPEQETQALDTSGVELDPEPASLIEELADAPEHELAEPTEAADLDSVDILSVEADDYFDVEAGPADSDAETVNVAAERRTTAPVPDLAEAEELVQALEAQPRGYADDDDDDDDEPDWGQEVPAAPTSPAPERDEAIYREPRRQTGRRRSTGTNKAARRMIRWAVRLSGVALLGACIYFGAQYVASRMTPPEQAIADVSGMIDAGRHAEASEAYQKFLATNPEHPQGAEMQFDEGANLYSAPAADADEKRDNNTRALALLKAFVDENPAHVRAPRAKTMAGLLHYRLGEYEKAIDCLRDPLLQLKDADSELPALRTLARAYTHLGDFDAATSAHLQAAALSMNFSPDIDYDRLGDLFKDRAERAQDPVERDQYRQAAVDNWTLAIRIPLIDPVNKAKIKTKRDWLQGQLGRGAGAPAAPGLLGDIPQQDASGALDSGTEAPDGGMTAPAEPEVASTALEALTETVPAPVDEPSPQEESAFLGGASNSPVSDELAAPPETPPVQSAEADDMVSDAAAAADSPEEDGAAASTEVDIPGENNVQAAQ